MERPQRFEALSLGGSAYEIDLDRALEVQVGVEVLDVMEVDCQSERFTATWLLKMRWTDPQLKDFCSTLHVLDEEGTVRELEGRICSRKRTEVRLLQGEDEGGELIFLQPWHILRESQPQWDKHFFPEHSYRNLVGPPQPLAPPRTRLEQCTAAGGVVTHEAKLVGTFCERLSLGPFPFDRQLLRMAIAAEGEGVERFVFVPMPSGSFGPRSVSVAEWGVDRNLQDACALHVVPVKERVHGATVQPACAKVGVHIERQAELYLYNLYLWLFLVVLGPGSGVCIVVPLEDMDQRAILEAIFILITVFYKYMVKDWIPRKPYFTRFDRHVLKALALQLLLALEGAALRGACRCGSGLCLGGLGRRLPVGPAAGCPEAVEDLDSWLWLLAYAWWVLDHVRLWYLARRCRSRPLLPSWEEVYAEAGERYSELPPGLLQMLGVPREPPKPPGTQEAQQQDGMEAGPRLHQVRRRDADQSKLRRGCELVLAARRAEPPRPAYEGQVSEASGRFDELLRLLRRLERSLAKAGPAAPSARADPAANGHRPPLPPRQEPGGGGGSGRRARGRDRGDAPVRG